jgi:hypothetical protein
MSDLLFKMYRAAQNKNVEIKKQLCDFSALKRGAFIREKTPSAFKQTSFSKE